MSTTSGNGGVRNLRAMFENKSTSDQSASPPSRGRSPNPSDISNTSRPVSTVRTSFVAVDKAAENGDAHVVEPGKAGHWTSASMADASKMDATGGAPKGDHTEQSVGQLAKAGAGGARVGESSSATINGADNAGGLGNILKGSPFLDTTPVKDFSEAKNLSDALSSGLAQQRLAKPSPSEPQNSSRAGAMVEQMRSNHRDNSGPPPSTLLRTTKTAQPVKPPPTRQSPSKSSPRSPVSTKSLPRSPSSPLATIRGGPAKIKGVMESAKQAQEAREATNQSHSNPPVPEGPSRLTPPAPAGNKEKMSAAREAIKSPKTSAPKPQTRSVQLPSVATAATASSSARSGKQPSTATTEPSSRSTTTKRTSTLGMRPPRVSIVSTAASKAKAASRASVGPTPNRPNARVSVGQVDEGFLARMMRPTTSSAQKAHDKVQSSSSPRKARTSSVHKLDEASRPKQRLSTAASATSNHSAHGTKVDGGRGEPGALPEVDVVSPIQVADTEPMVLAVLPEPTSKQPAKGQLVNKTNDEA